MAITTTNVLPFLTIRKSNALIAARYQLTVWQQRLIMTLLMRISPKDEDFKCCTIDISELGKLWDLKNGYKNVQEAAETLEGKMLQVRDASGAWSDCAWLSHVRYEKGLGKISLQFNDKLKPYLLQLKKHFTQYEIQHVLVESSAGITLRPSPLDLDVRLSSHPAPEYYELAIALLMCSYWWQL